MPYAQINGIEMFYEIHGKGFPLVFVHGGFGGLGTGMGGGVPAWVEKFAVDFEVILYDRRSSGRSGYSETPHSMTQFADDIHELLIHLGHERAHVWGVSAGGPITLTFGFEHPQSAQSLVITDSAPWLSRDAELLSALRQRIEILDKNGPEAAYEARRSGGTVGIDLFAPNASAPARRTPTDSPAGGATAGGADAIRAQLASVSREERIAKYAGELRTYSAYVDWDGTSGFSQLPMPSLVLYGAEDRVFPDAGWEQLCSANQHALYRVYPGVGHGLTGRAPGALDEILAFLKANSS